MKLLFRHVPSAACAAALTLCLEAAYAQVPPPVAPPAQASPQNGPTPEPPKGTVLIQSHGDAPEPDAQAPATPAVPNPPKGKTPDPTGPEFTDTERAAITVTRYDLDARIAPATSRLTMRARLTLRNDDKDPLTRIGLQISSTLDWESASLAGASGNTPLQFGQHLLDTDADHTGRAKEAVFVLPSPLAPGATLTLDTFYSGPLPVSTGRLERIGATHEQGLRADWDGISADQIALRGFGNVLWYPVAAPQVFLGEGAQLFDAIGHAELRGEDARVRLRLGIDYQNGPPLAVYFCGRRQALHAVYDDPNAPAASGSGVATADFEEQPLGFRMPSLFLVQLSEVMLAPLPVPVYLGTEARTANLSASVALEAGTFSSSATTATPEPPRPQRTTGTVLEETGGHGAPVLAVVSGDEGALPALAANAVRVAPLLQEWLGPQPLSALTVIDQPGQPFEDGPLLVTPVSSLGVSTALPALAHSLTHAWLQTGRPWMDEGLAQFMVLLSIERESGREAAQTQLADVLQSLALAEPEMEEGKPAAEGQPLVAATSEIFFRRKAAAVWWMLRGLAGDQALQQALHRWVARKPVTGASAQDDAAAFEKLLEETSRKDFGWFFQDWVFRDRGLPDLSITDVTPRERPAPASGRSGQWLVSVTVHNDGAAAAEVPVVVRSGDFSATSSLRVPGFSSATARVLVESAPTEVVVNDGNTPEQRVSRHTRTLVARTQ